MCVFVYVCVCMIYYPERLCLWLLYVQSILVGSRLA